MLGLKTDELDIQLSRRAVEIFFETITAHIAKQDVDIDCRIQFFEFQGVLERLATTDATAVVAPFFTTTDALDHHQAFCSGDAGVLCDYLPFQFQLGEHPLVAAVEIFRRAVLCGAGGNDGDAVGNLPYPARRGDAGDKIADIAVYILNACLG